MGEEPDGQRKEKEGSNTTPCINRHRGHASALSQSIEPIFEI
jgi:hypothetical protein